MNKDLAQRRVSVAQWKSIGARNPKVGRSILNGDSECFLYSTLETRQKTSFSISLLSSKLTISLILFTLQSCMQLAHLPRKTTSVFSRMFPEQKQIMQTTCSSLIKFSSVTFWPIRRFKEQKPVQEVEPFTCYWSKFKGYSVKVPSVLLLYVQTFRTESGCVSLSVSRKLSSSKQWPQKQVRILISSKMHQRCLIELTGLGLYHNFFQQSMLQLHRIPPTFQWKGVE